ncbi:DUF2179 domain-containing protein [Aerococcaceae bacterium DSM 111176]|nr:DUF2179 domain-containing protein [Aerococcaceae bacterium DSM 111176]
MDWTILIQIFFINLVYISINTIRVILTMRGYRKVAPFIAMIEVIIYTLGLSIVMQYISQPIYLITYAVGFGVGIYTGMIIEDKLALGYSVVHIITNSTDHTLAQNLRTLGYGVTIQPGYGRDGDRLVLMALTPRSEERKLYDAIEELSPSAFYYASEAKYIKGGFMTKRMKSKPVDQPELLSEMQAEQDEFMTKDEYIDDSSNK